MSVVSTHLSQPHPLPLGFVPEGAAEGSGKNFDRRGLHLSLEIEFHPVWKKKVPKTLNISGGIQERAAMDLFLLDQCTPHPMISIRQLQTLHTLHPTTVPLCTPAHLPTLKDLGMFSGLPTPVHLHHQGPKVPVLWSLLQGM